jgi:hypothetical protein
LVLVGGGEEQDVLQEAARIGAIPVKPGARQESI